MTLWYWTSAHITATAANADAVQRNFLTTCVKGAGGFAGAEQHLLAKHEDDQTRDHADSGKTEAVSPSRSVSPR